MINGETRILSLLYDWHKIQGTYPENTEKTLKLFNIQREYELSEEDLIYLIKRGMRISTVVPVAAKIYHTFESVAMSFVAVTGVASFSEHFIQVLFHLVLEARIPSANWNDSILEFLRLQNASKKDIVMISNMFRSLTQNLWLANEN